MFPIWHAAGFEQEFRCCTNPKPKTLNRKQWSKNIVMSPRWHIWEMSTLFIKHDYMCQLQPGRLHEGRWKFPLLLLWITTPDIAWGDCHGNHVNTGVRKGYSIRGAQGQPIIDQTVIGVYTTKDMWIQRRPGWEHATADMNVADLTCWV